MIKKRGKDSWLIRIYLGRKVDGKEKYYCETFYAPLKSMAQARERELKQRLSRVGPKTEVQTLGDWLGRWLEETAPSVSRITIKGYRSHVNVLKPLIGHLSLWDLSAEKLTEALHGKLDHLEPRSKRNLYATLKTAVRAAIDARLAPQDALTGFKQPKVPKKARPVLSREDIQAILPILPQYKHGLVLRLLLLTGARLEEILGLTWSMVDWQKPAVVINQTVDITKREIKHETKTENSRRTVLLDKETMELLKAHKQTQANHTVRNIKREQELVFRAADGRPLKYSAIRKTWTAVKKRAGLPPEMRIHDIRHSVVTLLLSEGVPPIVVASLVGHNVATTVSKYAQQVRTGKSLLLLQRS